MTRRQLALFDLLSAVAAVQSAKSKYDKEAANLQLKNANDAWLKVCKEKGNDTNM